jgi:hypothetical protein
MAVQDPWVTVGTTPVELTAAPDGDYVPGSTLVVQAPPGATLWVGGPTVDGTTRGFPIAPGANGAFDLQPGDRLYAVLTAGTGTAYVLRTGV